MQYIGDNDSAYFPLRISAEHARDRAFRYTELRELPADTHVDIGRELVGWEWDAASPADTVTVLAASPVYGAVLTDDGNSKHRLAQTAHAHTTRYTAPSGAQVFATGTMQWSWGLALREPDARMQQITCNVLADMGLYPATPALTLRFDDDPPVELPLPAINTDADLTTPAFTIVALHPTDTALTVQWQADRDVRAQVWLGHSAELVNEVQNAPGEPAPAGQFTVEGLQPGTRYFVRVAAWVCAEHVAFSETQSFETHPPGSPTGLKRVASEVIAPVVCVSRPAWRWARTNERLATTAGVAAALVTSVGGWRWAARWQTARATLKTATGAPPANRLAWVDGMKGLALVWIFINHLAERLFGYPWIGNPSAGWPTFAERVGQLQPLTGHGVWDVLFNMVRYVGWLGDNGVQLFLITGGFGLTWGLLARGQTGPLRVREFFVRRAARLYPLWWVGHTLFLMPAVLLGRGPNPTELAFYLSLAGLRITPETLYYFVPAWWYVTLLLQLYLVYPWLWRALQRLGPRHFLLIVGGAALFIRGAGLFFFTDYLDAWSRGAVFITRLPEFAFGMALAMWWQRDADHVERILAAPASLALAGLGWGVGLALALTLAGMTVAPFVLGLSAFVIFYQVLRAWRHPRMAQWLGGHSYSLYLVHHPVLLLLVPLGAVLSMSTGLRIGAAVALTVTLGVALERGTNWLLSRRNGFISRSR